MPTIKQEVQVELRECLTCSSFITLTLRQLEQFREDHRTFYCPLGHTSHFPAKSEADKLHDQLTVAQDRVRQVEFERNSASNMLEAETRKRRKLEKRIRNGVCPQCRRSFVNLQRHMAGRHPFK